MKEDIKGYIDKYPHELQELYRKLRALIYESVPQEIEEKLWAKLPSYYVEDSFVRLIPFKDHINLEASAVPAYREQLKGYKITPKGMLQIYSVQSIPEDIIKQICMDTFNK
ncbi:MAG: DUF1801 domain-containing protein [Lachnospiraceae bacterium]|nr:DUF1801 domain-containing protein [Lachnospiraceae bacterium]